MSPPCNLECFVDASWACDIHDGRSVTGYVFMLNGSPVTWASKKQATVAKSTSEAEFYALSGAASEAGWLMQFISQIGTNICPIRMFEDNQGAQKFATNPIAHARMKHVGVQHFFVRELVEDGIIQLKHIPSGEMVADMLTKPLLTQLFEKHRKSLNVHSKEKWEGKK